MELDKLRIDLLPGEPIAVLTINRPEKLNSITMAMRGEIVRAFDALGADPGVRVIIVRGEGDRAFSAGGDIPEFAQFPPHQLTELAHTVGAPERCPKPVIAAIDGYCFGGGLEFALSCDFRYATPTSQFALPEITLGALPGSGGTQRTVRLMGLARAKAMVLTGRPIDAAKAERWGLVTEVVAREHLMETVTELARHLVTLSPVSLKFAKQVLNKALDGPISNGFEMEGKAMAILCGMEDFHEGVAAWKERRKAVFHGR